MLSKHWLSIYVPCRRFSSCLACSLFGSRSSSQLDNDALLLDMGEYYVPALAPIIPTAASGSSSGTDGGGSSNAASTGVSRILAAAGAGRAAVAAAAAATVSGAVSKADSKAGGGGGGVQLVPHTLQLYSISPRPLADRAKAWGSGLNFKQSSEVMARPFFDAPGAIRWCTGGNNAWMLLLPDL
jgi:hypothetical protein